MLKKLGFYTALSFIIIIITAPCYLYWRTFHIYGLSEKNQDWSNLGSFIGGIYSAAFGFLSTVILCATLYLTLNYNKKQLLQLQRDSVKNLLVHHINSLNEKLNNRKNKYFSAVNGFYIPTNEYNYLEHLESTYKTIVGLKRHNDPNWRFNPAEATLETLTSLRITYPEELTIILNILNIIYNSKDNQIINESIDLFASLTYRNRTYWLLSYAYFNNEEARKCLISHPKLWALADGLQI